MYNDERPKQCDDLHSYKNIKDSEQKRSKDNENKNTIPNKTVKSQYSYPVSQINEHAEILQNINSQTQLDKYEELYKNNYDLNLANLYRGPYYAYIEHENKNAGRLHEMKIGHILHNELGIIDSVKEISFIGINRVKIQINTLKDVHSLVLNPLLKTKGFKCYVPRHLTERRGVIRRVDTYFSEE